MEVAWTKKTTTTRRVTMKTKTWKMLKETTITQERKNRLSLQETENGLNGAGLKGDKELLIVESHFLGPIRRTCFIFGMC
mmetsp:Transcript_28954/g.83988  ORF Transcript_28954/g.83988 Transcript_28954/m.83988 type:complete len:80 (-) Transcript_28954:33-272(-)